MRVFNLLAAFVVVSFLTGCAGQRFVANSHEANESRYKQLDIETEGMIKSIEGSLLILAETRKGKVSLNSNPDEMRTREWLYRVTPSGMGVPITINQFNGHPEVVIDMIASMTGYAVENVGIPSANTRNVVVSYISRPAVEALRSVSEQMACDGLVDVMGANRKIVIDWTIRKRGACK